MDTRNILTECADGFRNSAFRPPEHRVSTSFRHCLIHDSGVAECPGFCSRSTFVPVGFLARTYGPLLGRNPPGRIVAMALICLRAGCFGRNATRTKNGRAPMTAG